MDTLSRYHILAEVGRGGMGVVHHAFDPVLSRPVAIKSVSFSENAVDEEEPVLQERLIREARAAAALLHPNIVAVYDVIQEVDAAHIVMEFVAGRTLERELAESPARTLEWRLGALADIADALDYAHSHGVFHRDIKPANLMVDTAGRVKIADFGVAKVLGQNTLTQTGVVLGSPYYTTPEQLNGEPVTGRTDQFALGAVAYFMLTGRRAFEADSMPGVFHRILSEPAPPAPGLPAAAEEALARAMAKKPAERYETCAQFAAALKQALVGAAPAPQRAAKRWQSAWIPAALIFVMVVTAVIAVVALRAGRGHREPAAPEAAAPTAATTASPPAVEPPAPAPGKIVPPAKTVEPPATGPAKGVGPPAAGGSTTAAGPGTGPPAVVPPKAQTFLWVLDRSYSLRLLDESGALIRNVARVSIDLKIGGNRVFAASPSGKFAVAAGAYQDSNRLARYNLDGSVPWTIQQGQYTAVDVGGSVYAIKRGAGPLASVLQKIDPENGSVEQEIALPRAYFDVAVDEKNNSVWIAGQAVSRFDLNLKEQGRSQDVGWYVVSIDYAADGTLFGAERRHSQGLGQDRLLRIGAGGQVVGVPLEFSPVRVAVNRAKGDVWVMGASGSQPAVSRFAADDVQAAPATFPVGQAMYGDAAPDGSLWLALRQKNALVRLSRDGEIVKELPGLRAEAACLAVRSGDVLGR